MDLGALLFASASLPILIFHGMWYREERKIESVYGIFSGLFAFFGALVVVYGLSGTVIMPSTFAILSLGSFHAYFIEKDRKTIIKASAFLIVSIAIVILEVML